MPILADQHMHTSFSFDSKASMKDMIDSAINKGLKHINITEHNDFEYPVDEKNPVGCWDLNVDSYLYELLNLREVYKDKIQIGFGIEIGMQEVAFRKNAVLAHSHEFDYCIGSIHLVNGVDTYDPKYYEDKTPKAAFEEYYDCVIRNIRQFQNFDALGHLDYLTRKIPGGEDVYSPLDYIDRVDEIFNILIKDEKGLELNTQAFARGFKNPNPCPALLKRYKELGGEIIVVGSDAHTPEGIAAGFDIAEEMLKDAGFKYYCVFKDRIPTFQKF